MLDCASGWQSERLEGAASSTSRCDPPRPADCRFASVRAVDEVGNPTILATLTVVAAILPMAFVGGLMGPCMRPIPVGASAAMLFSLAAAVIVGSAVILFDPIFQGLAISLMAGEVASLLLSRVTVPVLYVMSHQRRHAAAPSVVPSPAGALS